ncbi:MAG: DUF6573 family protein [Candidatus Methylomirabilales bacterium]
MRSPSLSPPAEGSAQDAIAVVPEAHAAPPEAATVPQPADNLWEGAEVIAEYSRARALEDGILVDATPLAQEAGIHYPVALTREVWNRYVKVPAGVQCQDETGRLWDILWMLQLAARSATTDELHFLVDGRNDNARPRPVQLKAICSPGDDPTPVITVLLPTET